MPSTAMLTQFAGALLIEHGGPEPQRMRVHRVADRQLGQRRRPVLRGPIEPARARSFAASSSATQGAQAASRFSPQHRVDGLTDEPVQHEARQQAQHAHDDADLSQRLVEPTINRRSMPNIRGSLNLAAKLKVKRSRCWNRLNARTPPMPNRERPFLLTIGQLAQRRRNPSMLRFYEREGCSARRSSAVGYRLYRRPASGRCCSSAAPSDSASRWPTSARCSGEVGRQAPRPGRPAAAEDPAVRPGRSRRRTRPCRAARSTSNAG